MSSNSIYPGFVGERVNSKSKKVDQDDQSFFKDTNYYEGVITKLFTPLLRDNITDYIWEKMQRTLGAIIKEMKGELAITGRKINKTQEREKHIYREGDQHGNK